MANFTGIGSRELAFLYIIPLKNMVGTEDQASTVILCLALVVGFVKGRFIFTKTIARITRRIYSLPLPIRFSKVYPISYWCLIGSMMMLGMGMRYLSIPLDVKGFIDVAIGSALVQGAMIYLRIARAQASATS